MEVYACKEAGQTNQVGCNAGPWVEDMEKYPLNVYYFKSFGYSGLIVRKPRRTRTNEWHYVVIINPPKNTWLSYIDSSSIPFIMCSFSDTFMMKTFYGKYSDGSGFFRLDYVVPQIISPGYKDIRTDDNSLIPTSDTPISCPGQDLLIAKKSKYFSFEMIVDNVWNGIRNLVEIRDRFSY